MSQPKRGKGKRGMLTRSLIGEAADTSLDTGLVYTIARQFQQYIHMPDPQPLCVVLGAMASNMMHGKPVWLMLVGASGGGKTLLMDSLLNIPRVRMVASIKGDAALLSGVKKKDRAADATGGILRELGDNGCLLFTDFNTLLSQPKDEVSKMLGILRELYDGTWSRDIGGEGGRHLEHTGRVSLLAGVTHSIDRHTEANQEMGPRCLYYRLPKTDGFQESLAGLDVTNWDGVRADLRQIVKSMYDALGLDMEVRRERRQFDIWEKQRLANIAQLGSKLRGVIPRDYRDRSVVDVPSEELGTRMSIQLGQLFAGMEAIGVKPRECWQAMYKIALDSMPQTRRLALEVVMDAEVKGKESRYGAGSGSARTSDICGVVQVAESTAQRIVEDLRLLGAVKKKAAGWGLTEWARKRLVEDKQEVESGNVSDDEDKDEDQESDAEVTEWLQ